MEIVLKHLDTATMLAITGSWIDEPTFASVAEVRPLLAKVKTVHANLLAAKPSQAVTSKSAADLSEALQALDLRHDHALRVLYYLLEAASEAALSQDPPDVAASSGFLETRKALLPDGLNGTRLTYLAEEGNAKRAEEAFANDDAHKQRLSALRLSKSVTGLDLFASYTKLADELGDLERQKTSALGAASDKATPATLAKARNAWINLVGTIVRVLDHAEGDTARSLWRAVSDPAEKAAKAVKAASKAAKPTP